MAQTAIGGAIGMGLGAYGDKVKIPDLPAIDINAVQSDTIGANKASLPGAEAIGAEINSFNIKQQLAALIQTMNVLAPGQLEKVQGITASQLSGEVPLDVQQQLQRKAVSGSYGRGYGPSSGLASNDFLRNFGITSMGIQQQGIQNFQTLSNMGPKAPLFDVSSMFFSPQQRLAFAFQERQAQFNVNLMKAQIAAAPDPAMAQIAEGIDSDIKMVEQAALSYAGGGMGGGGSSFYSGSNPKGVEGSGAGKMPSGGWGSVDHSSGE